MSLEIMERMEINNLHPPFVDLKLWGKKKLYHFFEFKLKTPKISKINCCNCAKIYQRKKITSMGKEP
jgi:hypothetical protein